MSLTQQFPNHSFGWKALGALFKQTGRLNDSLFPMQKSVELSPYDEEAHSNLGNTLKELGRLDEAEARYKKAIALKSDYADAHYNLGVILQESNRLEKAEASYRKAIALKPDLAQAYINLGLVLKDLGRLDEAISTYVQAINSKVDVHDAFTGLGAALKGARFSEGNKSLHPILINLLAARNFVRPSTVAPAILSLLMKDVRIERLLTNPPTFANIKQVHRVTKTLAQVPLLHELMRICPLPELQFEVVFVSIRRVLLSSLRQIQASPELIYFLSTLSLHCFTNEYIYFETEEEAKLISILERSISEIMAQAGQPDILEILCLATYRPLHQYDWSEKLRVLKELPEVQLRLIEEPQAERAIARSTLLLASVSDAVSRKVREQYEVNPYPRWVGLAIPSKAKSVAEVCAEVKLKLQSDSIKSVGAPSILIAGCGTGQHSIETACRYAKCNVTAVDLSLASLAYAQRKLSELRINNSEYLQADILNLEELGREFDIIESLGVLHHMDDPMAGWRVLVNLLKTGGLMKIGLYSELARHNIAQIREEIAAEGISTSEAEIRQFRQSLVESRLAHHQRMTDFDDFFSFSMFRDLVFHVQEHCFTLPQIKGCLSELGLKFCGFESAEAVTRFKKFHGEESDTCDLMLWHDFEQSNSRTFEGMYQFWCQKV